MVAVTPINMPQFSFEIEHNQGSARVGEFHTPHGLLTTPAFMPVGTQAAVKTLTPEEVTAVGVEMLLCNAYHMFLRPGVGTVQRLGGVHRFMGWSGPVLTDSGGFQVFSMGALRRVDDFGVLFRSHLDGSEHLFSPELAIANQARLAPTS